VTNATPTSDASRARSTVLPNGVRVIVQELCTAPVVALNLWVGTGGVDDPDGLEGTAHFIEHMLFKPGRGGGSDLASRVYGAGGYVNAMTGPDHTTYYQVVPSATWREVMAAQAAALTSDRFDPAEVETERAVILEELRSGEANPDVLVWRRLMATGFTRHPLRRPVVGTEESLGAMTADTITDHYRAHYAGGNLTLVVVGDVDADEVFAEADRLFRAVPPGERPASHGVTEPEQTSLRAQSISGPVAQPYLSIAFHAPEALHGDIVSLDALSGLLGQGKSSRLRKRLGLDAGLVSDISCGVVGYRDTGLLIVRASLTTPDVGVVVAGVIDEIAGFADSPPTTAEMEKNLRRLEAAYLLEHETPETIAGGLGYFAVLGDWRLAETYIDRLATVTPADVGRVASRYLRPGNATLVAYGPTDSSLPEGDIAPFIADALAVGIEGTERRGAPGETDTVRERGPVWESRGFERPMILAERRAPLRTRETLASGATLITSSSETLPLASIAVGFRGGHCEESDETSGATYLGMRAAVRGTTMRSGFELADEVESMGTSLATIVDRDGFGVGSTCLARLQGDAASLLGEVVLEPAFDPDQTALARTEVEGEIGETEDHPFRRAVLEILPLVFPEHPYGRALRGTRETLRTLDADALRKGQVAATAADRLIVCASGKVDASVLRDSAERLAAGVEDRRRTTASDARGGDATGGAGRVTTGVGTRPVTPPTPPVLRESVELTHGLPGQSQIALGLAGPPAGSDDAVCLRFVTRALSMMGGPLWVALRENPPHAYAVHASSLLLAAGGAVLLSVTGRPGSESAAVDGLLSVLRETVTRGLDAEVLTRARNYVAGTMEIAMQRESTRAASYAMSELLGVGFERMERMPSEIRGLTNDDVVRVSSKWLDPDAGYARVVLGSD